MRAAVGIGLAAATLGAPALASAQASPTGDGSVPEVVVTAQRRAQNAIDVPVTTSRLSGQALDDLRLNDLRDVSVLVPGFLVSGVAPEDARFEIRGISSSNASSFQEPRISVFHNNVSTSRTRTALGELYDVDRVEISRGPQSTLFGRAALIGAVQIFDNLPDPSREETRSAVEVGDLGQRLVEGMINLPLEDTLAVRGAFRVRHRDGDVANALGGGALDAVNVGAGRVSVSWRPVAALRTTLLVDYERDFDDGLGRRSHTFAPSDPVTGKLLGDARASSPAALAAGSGFEGNRGLGGDRRTWRATGLVDWTLSPHVLISSVTGYVGDHSRRIDDVDGTSLPLVTLGDDSRSQDVSEDLRAIFTDAGPVSGTIGAFYGASRASQRTPLQYDERALLGLLSGYLNRAVLTSGPLARYTNAGVNARILQALAFFYDSDQLVVPLAQALGVAQNLSPDHREEYRDDSEVQSADIYADADIRISRRLTLDAGLRFGHDDKTSGFYSRTLNGRSILGGVLAALNAPPALRAPLFAALSVPNAATLPPSADYPVPEFGLQAQPTAGNGARSAETLTDDGLSWRFAADYALSDTWHAYATYGRGRRPAVLDPEAPQAPGGPVQFTRAAAETVDSLEAGMKSRWFDRRLSLDIATYGYRYAHFQTLRLVGTEFITQDAGRADAVGVEAQARWRLNRALSIFSTYAFNHTRFGAGLYEGNVPAFSPDHSGSVGAVAAADVLGGELRLMPTLSWRSKAFFTDDDSKAQDLAGVFILPRVLDFYQGGYSTLDARLRYTPSRARWSLEAFATNLADTRYLVSAGDGGQNFGLPTYLYGAPRLVGVRFQIQMPG